MAESEMRVEYMPLGALKRAPRNPKLHDLEQLDQSIERFGYVQPILVNEATGQIVAGHGRLDALSTMKAAGKTAPGRVRVMNGDWQVPVLRGISFKDDREAEAYLVADNRLVEIGGWDEKVLAGMLNDLQVGSVNLDGLGYNQHDLTTLFKNLEVEGVLGSATGDDDKGYVEVVPNAKIIEVASAYFRSKGFDAVKSRGLPLAGIMYRLNKLAGRPLDGLIGSSVFGSRILDSYCGHRMDVKVNGMHTPREGFDKPGTLEAAVRWEITGNALSDELPSVFYQAHGIQTATNFPPGYAAYIFRKYGTPGCWALDTSNGFGGRLIGALASRCVEFYLGIDPAVETQNVNRRLLTDLGKEAFAEFVTSAAEDYAPPDEYIGKFQVAFTSPPYFRKELYSDDEGQSCVRYTDYDAWLQGFLQPVARLQKKLLRQGGYSIINIDDVLIKGRAYPLVNAAKEAMLSAGFVFESNERTVAYGSSNTDGPHSSEVSLVFKGV